MPRTSTAVARRRSSGPAKGARPGPGEQRADFAYAKLKEAIVTGKLQPGDRVAEVALAERLHISRTPVREALRRLEFEGLCTRTPRGALTVTKLAPDQIHDLYALREALEGMAAALAARYASDGQITALRSLVARERELGEDARQLSLLNRQFHDILYQAARNTFLLSALNALRDTLVLLKDTTFSVARRPAEALVEHERIVDAIARRDPAAADRATREHIQMAADARVVLTLMVDHVEAAEQTGRA